MNLATQEMRESGNPRSGFTLVEMLIVVAILAILMSITFKLVGVGDEDARRAETLVKLQKVENCLSGYYAAFGSYPPVKVQGTRDIYCAVDENGDQDQRKSGNSNLDWSQVNAACRCQPFGCEYPGDQYDNEIIESWAEELKERVNSNDFPKYKESSFAPIFQMGFTGPEYGDFRGATIKGTGQKAWNTSDWKFVKLFKFGMMSFLLPRYLFMMGGDRHFFGDGGNACAQWDDNNDMPCDPFEGREFDDWGDIRDYSQITQEGTKNQQDLARVANIPSQAVSARWMPNLEESCRTLRHLEFFGITINKGDETGLWLGDEYPPDPGTHYTPNGRVPYKNAFVTILDGWDREFYYYSPSPHQSYVVWSAGPNGRTFPPWMSLDKVKNANDKKTAADWMHDDVRQMSH